MDVIIEYFIQKGGIWGLLLALSFAWIIFREKTLASLGKTEGKKVNLSESIEKLTSKHDLSQAKLEEIGRAVDDFKELTSRQAKAAQALQEKLQEVNDERVSELKQILQDYNKTMAELSFGIEKMNLILEMKLGESK